MTNASRSKGATNHHRACAPLPDLFPYGGSAVTTALIRGATALPPQDRRARMIPNLPASQPVLEHRPAGAPPCLLDLRAGLHDVERRRGSHSTWSTSMDR